MAQHHHDPSVHSHADQTSLNRTALSATVHCLTGCAIGEVLGMVLGTALAMRTWHTVALSILLAFVFGYSLTMLPLLRGGLGLRTAAALAFASDTASIALMELVDNVIMVYIPGAMEAGLGSPLFWASLIGSLLVAGVVAFPLNRWLIGRGRGHAILHAYHR